MQMSQVTAVDQKRICLFGGGYSSQNLGDQGTLIAIVRLLRARNPDSQIIVLSRNPTHIERYMAVEGLQVQALHRWRQLPSTLRALAQADLLAIGAGVPFFDAFSQVLTSTFLVLFTKLWGGRVMTYGPSTQHLRHPLIRYVYKRLLDQMDLVTVREPWSLKQFQALGLKKRVWLTADPVVTLRPADPQRIETLLIQEGIQPLLDRPLIGVTTRHLSASHPYRTHHYRKLSTEQIHQWHQCMAQSADYLTTLGQVVFIPMNTQDPDNDWETIRTVKSIMHHGSKTATISRRYTAPETMGIIGRCAFLLGSRAHSIIMAAARHVPFVSVAYDRKISGLCEHFHMERYNLDLIGLDDQALLARIYSAWEDRRNIAKRLRIRLEELRQVANRNADLAIHLCQETRRSRGSGDLP